MEWMKRFIKFLIGGAIPLIAAISIQGVVAIIISILYVIGAIISSVFIKSGGEKADINQVLDQIVEMSYSADMTYLISAIAILICGIVFFFWYRYLIRYGYRVNLRSIATKKNFGILLMLGIGCQLFVSGLLRLILPFLENINENYMKTMEQITGGNPIIVLLLVIVVGPVVEELIFRGVILHQTSQHISFIGANIFQAALFGVYHMNIVQGIYAFMIGLLLGYVYHKFRTILVPIVLHMIINASSFIMVLGRSTPAYLLMIGLGGGIIAYSIYLLRKFDDPESIIPSVEENFRREEK